MRATAFAAVCLAVLALPTASEARSSATFAYSLDEVYSTTVRFIRIDRGCTITDRDPHAAYLMFECKDGKQVRHGALELYPTPDGVRGQLTLTEEPEYMELRFLELLGRKVRDERGEPRQPVVAPHAPDGGHKE